MCRRGYAKTLSRDLPVFYLSKLCSFLSNAAILSMPTATWEPRIPDSAMAACARRDIFPAGVVAVSSTPRFKAVEAAKPYAMLLCTIFIRLKDCSVCKSRTRIFKSPAPCVSKCFPCWLLSWVVLRHDPSPQALDQSSCPTSLELLPLHHHLVGPQVPSRRVVPVV